MFNLIKTIGLIDGRPQVVDVEISLSRGKPQLVIIGLASKAIDEAKERISSALFSCEIKPKAKHTVVNLAPADVRKEGSGFDLPIAVGICKAYGLINFDTYDTVFIGEITLDGRLRKTKNILPFVLIAQVLGYKKIVIPAENLHELSGLESLEIFGAKSLKQLLKIKNLNELQKIIKRIENKTVENTNNELVKFEDIVGLNFAKRAVEIMVAGGHNLLIIGPAGAGKSTLAKATISILPDLTLQESIETSSLYAQKNLLKNGLINKRPFRSPHTSITEMSLIGGGKDLNLGEISLAHNGILFLDELSEYKNNILDQLRDPLESGQISINRIGREIIFPANFILLGATNPCPCGHKNSKIKKCICSQFAIQNFNKKFSGPIMDRIDMKIYLDQNFDLLRSNNKKVRAVAENLEANSPKSAEAKQRVELVREIQQQRYKNEAFKLNGKIPTQKIDLYCSLDSKAQDLLDKAYHSLKLSNRSYFKTIKIARTIADIECANSLLDKNDLIQERHIMEALQYRI